ncbi:Peptidase M16 domain protein [Raphanus sativus]|nr:Peptidase M16 domain protein [Raphanus sativus]
MNWYQSDFQKYKFDCHKKEADEIEFIEKDELRIWYNKYFKESSPSCRKFSVGVSGEGNTKRRKKNRLRHLKRRRASTKPCETDEDPMPPAYHTLFGLAHIYIIEVCVSQSMHAFVYTLIVLEHRFTDLTYKLVTRAHNLLLET